MKRISLPVPISSFRLASLICSCEPSSGLDVLLSGIELRVGILAVAGELLL
jgi:hypothetical protein